MAFLGTDRVETVQEVSPGDRVGEYVVVSALDEGGMACVYKAVGSNGRQVALKLIRHEVAGDVMFRRRFERDLAVSAPHVPSEVAWAAHRALEKAPERRPGSATAYARMLQAAAGASPLGL